MFSGAHEKLARGIQTKQLKGGVLLSNLADKMLEFNRLVDVLGKHPSADPFLPRRLDARSFTLREVTLLLMVMRQLSISLFDLLKRQGIHLQQEWKEFKSEWIKWNSATKLYPSVIAARQHPPKEIAEF